MWFEDAESDKAACRLGVSLRCVAWGKGSVVCNMLRADLNVSRFWGRRQEGKGCAWPKNVWKYAVRVVQRLRLCRCEG